MLRIITHLHEVSIVFFCVNKIKSRIPLDMQENSGNFSGMYFYVST